MDTQNIITALYVLALAAFPGDRNETLSEM